MASSLDFKQVKFLDIPESFAPGKSLDCRFVLAETFQASHRDWVGIYKVGWMSAAKDYVFYVWTTPPKSYVPGKMRENSVTFPGMIVKL